MKSLMRHHPLFRRILAGPRAIRHAWISWREEPWEKGLERISEIVKEDIIFEASEFGGIFSINPRSHLLHRFLRNGFYEPNISALFLAHIQPTDDILDVGANIGFFTVAGAKRLTTGRVLAAEPTTEAFSRLSDNVKRNGVADKVILYKGMIGAAKGEGDIHFVSGLEEYSSMNTPEHAAVKGKEVRTENVPIERLDDLVELHNLHPAVLKIDVEGAEYSVFNGAIKTISTYRPVVLSEICNKPTDGDCHTGNKIVQMFKDLDYIVRNPDDPRSEPDIEGVGEIICIPKERYYPSKLGL